VRGRERGRKKLDFVFHCFQSLSGERIVEKIFGRSRQRRTFEFSLALFDAFDASDAFDAIEEIRKLGLGDRLVRRHRGQQGKIPTNLLYAFKVCLQ
jgi:uncharacterized membrane protein YjdF